MTPKWPSSLKISPAIVGPSGSLKRKRSDPPAWNASKRSKTDYCAEWQTELIKCEERKKLLFEVTGVPQEIKISRNQMLDTVDVSLAIISVTEAITSQGMQKFCVYDATAFAHGSIAPDGTATPFFEIHRDERPIIFPWIKNTHIRLCYGQPGTDGHNDWAEITVYDSVKASCTSKRAIQRQIREHLQNSTWYRPQSDDYRFHWTDDTVWQFGGLMCGMHAIFNGWIRAFGLEPSARVVRRVSDPEIYASAERIIRLAIHGSASFDLIFSWLVCHGFINADAAVDGSRKFEWTIKIDDAGTLTAMLPEFRRRSETVSQQSLPPSDDLNDYSTRSVPSHSSGPSNHDPREGPRQTPKDISQPALEEASQETPLSSDPVCTKCPVDSHCVKPESRGPRASFKTSVERPWADFEPTGPVLSNKLDFQALKQWIDGRIKEAEASKRWLLLESDYPDSPNGKAIGTGSMIAAIASVTEAISLNESEKDFALYSIKAYKAAKRTPFKPHIDHLILGTRKELFIPISTGRWSNGKPKKQEKDEQLLAHVLPVHDDEQQITVQWAVSKVSGCNEKEKRRLETELEDLIRRLKWWSTSGEDLPGFNHDWNLRCRPQKSSVQSAIHVVLNAWAAALDQVLIPDSVPTDSDYNRAFEFIYRAFFGSLSAELIVAFLRDIGWVDSTRSISTHRNFRSTCKIYDDLLENHVKEQFPQMYPELATSSDPNAQSQRAGKDKRPTPVCNNCPVQGHCAGKGDGSPRQEEPFSAFWPEVADEFPCRFQKERVKDLIELEKLDLETQRKVRKGLESYISAETMRQAISAVTEAISLHGKKLFALYDRTNFSSSSTSAPPSLRLKSVEKDNEAATYGEQIIIPISERHLISASACSIDCNTPAGDVVPEVTHYFLPGPGDPSLPTAGIKRTLEGGAVRVLRGLQWFKGASAADAGAERTCAYHHTWRALPPLRTATHSGRTAPVHLILAAWTIALGFQPPTRGLAPAADDDDDALADLVALTCQGLLDAATLAAALRCARWLPPKAPVDEARRFDQTARFVDGKALAAHCAWVAEMGSASGPGPAFASRLVRDLNAEDARTGRWERLAGELRAERARAEVDAEARRRLASGQVARRPGTSHWATELVGPFEVDEGSAVYGVVGAKWWAHEVHEMSREDLARLFRNPPADIYLHDMKRLMVDAAELHFELKDMEAEEGW